MSTNNDVPERLLTTEEVRRFLKTFATVFICGGLAWTLFAKHSERGSKVVPENLPQQNSEAATLPLPFPSASSGIEQAGEKPAPSPAPSSPASIRTAVKNSEREDSSHPRAKGDAFSATNRPLVIEEESGTGLTISEVSPDAASSSLNQDISSAPASQAAAARAQPQSGSVVNFPATEPVDVVPVPRTRGYPYTAEQLLYRTLYGWNAFNAAQEQQ